MLIKRSGMLSLFLACSCFIPVIGHADDTAASKSPQNPEAAPIVPRLTVKATKGPLASSVTVKGTVEAENQSDVKVRLKAWASPLIVEHAIPHGSLVRQGDLLLRFEIEKLEQQIRMNREDRESAVLAIRLAEHELPILRQQLPLDLQAAERQRKQTTEDLQLFLKVEKAHEIEATENMLRSAEFSLESSRDELVQLEKMYKDKDLTEETERMILKRYQFSVKQSELMLRTTKLHAEKTLKVTLPRREEAAELAAAKAELSWAKAKEDLPLHLHQKQLAFEKMRQDERRAREKLEELQQDMTQLLVSAPADGVVYYGRYANGQWSTPAATAYLKGGTLPANDVIMTVVSKGKLFVYAEVEEKELGAIRPGQPARITPTVAPQSKLNGKVHRIVPVPQGGKYQVLIALADDVPKIIIPGMTGSVKIITHQSDAALTVPSTAVFEDTETEESYVYLPGEKPVKKVVKTGVVSGGKTEILEGLKDGDVKTGVVSGGKTNPNS